MRPIQIIGIGSPLGADRTGWEAVQRLAGLAKDFPAGAVTMTCLDRPGSLLLDTLAGSEAAILIDAVWAAERLPGTVLPLTLDELRALEAPLSSHGVGVAEALALGRALHCLPPRLAILGITVAGAAPGQGDEATAAALPTLDRCIRELVLDWRAAPRGAAGQS